MDDAREICSLSDDALEARKQQLRDELVPHVRSRAALTDGMRLTFDATPERRRQLDDFVAFERGCCAGLRFALREQGGVIQLEIRGLDPQSSVLMRSGPPKSPSSTGCGC